VPYGVLQGPQFIGDKNNQISRLVNVGASPQFRIRSFCNISERTLANPLSKGRGIEKSMLGYNEQANELDATKC
jgi:hypothetical protein